MATIRIFLQGRLQAEETLDPFGTLVGRGDDAELKLDEKKLSKRHARLFPDGKHWIVEDLASRNGTFVNGRREVRCELSDGDRIELGAFVLVFHLAPGEHIPPLPDLPDLRAELTPVKRPGGGEVYQRRSNSTEEGGLRTMAQIRNEARALMMPRLARIGPGEPAFFPLQKARATIGGKQCDLVVDPAKSHELAAVVRLDDGTFELQKSGWISRVKVNGATVNRHVLDVDDIVDLGGSKWVYELPVA